MSLLSIHPFSGETDLNLKTEARARLQDMNDELRQASPARALAIIDDGYDLIHRLAFDRPAPVEIIRGHIMAAFKAFSDGDHEVDIYQLYEAIYQALHTHRDLSFLGSPQDWMLRSLARWHAAYIPHTSQENILASLPLYDRLSQVRQLLLSDLWAFEGSNQPRYKQALALTHLPLISSPSADLRTQRVQYRLSSLLPSYT